MEDSFIKNTIANNVQSLQSGPLQRLGQHTRQPDKVDQAAKEFESVFISQMLQPMFEGIDVDPMFGGGSGEKVWRNMLVQEYGKIISQSGGIGIADNIKVELLKAQESQQGL